MTPKVVAPLALVFALSGPAARAEGGPSAARPAREVRLAAVLLWPPPQGAASGGSGRKKAKVHPPRTNSPGGEDLRPRAETESTASLEAEVFGPGGGDGPTTVRRRPPLLEEDDDDRSSTVLPAAIAPHLVSVGLGVSMVGRSFGFDAPLQAENTFPRPGVSASFETYPVVYFRPRSWLAGLGVGATFEHEIGSAEIGQADGATLGFPVSEGRWSIDLRYALSFRDRFVLVPRVGYGHSGFDVERRTETTAPSMCTGTSTQVCLPDVQVSHVTVGVEGRLSVAPAWALTAGAALLPAFGVGRGRGQLGAESAVSAFGTSVDLGVGWQITPWLIARAVVPVTHYSYSFSAPTVMYKSASETTYGLTVGATVFTM
jgi:hypothetical protein